MYLTKNIYSEFENAAANMGKFRRNFQTPFYTVNVGIFQNPFLVPTYLTYGTFMLNFMPLDLTVFGDTSVNESVWQFLIL